MAAAPPPTFPPTPESTREFVPLSKRPMVRFLTTDVPPPSPVYVARDDVLFIRLWNSVAALNAQVTVRLLLPNGEIIPDVFNLLPTSDRTRNDFQRNLAEGFLLSISIGQVAATPRRGQTFCELFLFRGTASNPFTAQLLVSDYVVAGQHIGWPYPQIRQSVEGPGVIRTIVGTTPAVGADITETVPTNARWKLRSLASVFTTGITVATRNVDFALDDGVNLFYMVAAQITQLASLSRRYVLATHGQYSGLFDLTVECPSPIDTPLASGYRIRTVTTALQATDSWTAPIYEVEEWIEE